MDRDLSRPDLLLLFEVVAAFAKLHYANIQAITIRLELQDGGSTHISVPPCARHHHPPPDATPMPAAPVRPPEPADDTLNELEAAIAEVVDSLGDGERLTGEEVSERSGYTYNGRFKEALARLGRVGRIRSCHPGYARQTGRERRPRDSA